MKNEKKYQLILKLQVKYIQNLKKNSNHHINRDNNRSRYTKEIE